MFKWSLFKEPDMCERKLTRVMNRLKIKEFNFNWDRSSCFIEFKYQGNLYGMEHSIQKAKGKGILMTRNGLDCLFELIQSLEDLCPIIARGPYKLEDWISGIKQSSPAETPDFLEEVHISYKALGKQKHSEYNRNEEFIHAVPESSLGDFIPNRIIQRNDRKENRDLLE